MKNTSSLNSVSQFTLYTAVILCLMQPSAEAGIRYWVGGSGLWTDTGNWSLGQGGAGGASVPAGGDYAHISLSDSINRVITYQQPVSLSLTNVQFDNSGGGSLEVVQTQDELNAGTGIIGVSGNATLSVSGGSVDIGSLFLGNQLGSTGTINLSNSGEITSTLINIGGNGAGNFNQTGGTATFSTLKLGSQTTGTGSYTLDDGTLTTTGTTVGDLGHGTFTQNGGSHSITGNLIIDTTSTYNMTGGVLSASLISGAINFTGGTINANTVNASGGTFVLNNGEVLNANYITGGSYNLSNGHVLDIVSAVSSSFTLAGASTLNAPDITLNSGNSLDVTGGSALNVTNLTLNANSSVNITGTPFQFTTLTQNGGTMDSDVTVDAESTFTYITGAFNGSLMNNGLAEINGNYTSAGGITNNSTINVAAGKSVTADGSGLVNSSVMNMAGGMISGSGPIDNGGTITSSGSLAIGGSSGFTNDGVITMNGGALTLGNSGATQNNGTMNLAFLGNMTLDTGLSNSGLVDMKGGNLAGPGTFTNTAAGTLVGSGAVTNDIVNAGLISARSGNLTVGGGSFTNTGLVRNTVGSNLFVTATAVNHTGSIEVNAAGSVVFNDAVTNNPGETVTLYGGALGTGGLVNAEGGTISGFGSLTGSLTNAGNVDFFGTTSLVGDLENLGTGHFLVRNDQTLVTGHTTNDGTIETLNGQVIFEGGLTNNGALLFDPATITVSTLDVGGTGFLAESGPPGDRFIITRDFNNASVENAQWSTDNTVFQFNGGSRDMGDPQLLEVAGIDIGSTAAGWTDNFVFGTLEIGSSATYVQLVDSFDNSADCLGGYCEIWNREALYVDNLVLDAGTVLDLAGLNLYVLGNFTDNGGSILNGTVTLASAVPLPATVYLFASGLLGLGVCSRRGREPVRKIPDHRRFGAASTATG